MTTLDNEFLAKSSNIFFCKFCNYTTSRNYNYKLHINSNKHKNNENDNKNNDFLAKNSNIFFCKFCNYTTCKNYNYKLHINSNKHKNNENNVFLAKTNKNYVCTVCNKSYNDRAGLWRHKKKCIGNQTNTTQNIIDKDDLIIQLLKQNAKLMEILENGTMNHSNNTTTNSHNKAFNLQFFLNETCKNAMNITDFVESIKLQLSDFMSMGDVGFVEGISNIIVKNLNSLDETIRPIHCTDQKRETFYVKDENKWEKEEEDKKRIKKMIRGIAYKNEKLIKVYKETYPDYNNPESRRSDQYSKIMIEAMDSRNESREKIIKNISKVTTVSKTL